MMRTKLKEPLYRIPEGSIREFFRHNAIYFLAYGLLFLIATFILLTTLVGDEIFWLNGRRTWFFDLVFRYGTRLGEEEAYLMLTILFLFVRYRTALTIPLVGISAGLLSAISKWIFAHERPGVFFTNAGVLDQLNLLDDYALNMGINSFPSGHTLSAFALYSFLAFSIREKRLSALFLLLVAVEVAVSRVYLVQHFLKDIYLGSMLGILIGMVMYYLQFRWLPYPSTWMDNSLLRRRTRLPATEELPSVKEQI